MSDDKPPSTNGPVKQGWFRRLLQGIGAGPRDRDEVIEVLREARDAKLFDGDEQAMLEGVFEVSELRVRDIMIPRFQMVVLDRDASSQELLKTIIESGHSRFPVIGEDRDEVVGILLAKDLLRYFVEDESGRFDIREVLRPPSFIPESKRLNVLLKDFRNSHNHMAVVVDEYGGVSGLLTIEDVLEQIVGDIGDEHDPDEVPDFSQESDGHYTIRALARIEDFNDEFKTQLGDEEFDTVGGLLIHELGRLPRRGESVLLDGIRFTVLKTDRRRVHTLRAQFPTNHEA